MTNALLSISADPGQPYIQVTGSGLWAAEDVERHFRSLDQALRVMRHRAGCARVLVDLSEAPVQTADAAELMDDWTARIYRENDQVAVVCGTTLLAMQIKRKTKGYRRETFPEKAAALAWLMADAPARTGRATQGVRRR